MVVIININIRYWHSSSTWTWLMSVFILLLITTDKSACFGNPTLPLVINTWAFTNATEIAWKALQAGESAEDSLVTGCTVCEVEQCDGSVGYGNHPDELGEVTLDAMIMDGDSMSVGAVGGLRRVKNAIGVARAVMRYTDHTLLVGESATKFAIEMGFKEESLSTNKSKELYLQWRKNKCQPNYRKNVTPDHKTSCGPYKPQQLLGRKNVQYARSVHPEINERNHDTIGMVVIDEKQHIYAGTSTNGMDHKVPGRVGDSPIMGAGAYASSQSGGAAATGDGDIMMRFLPSFQAVSLMEQGVPPQRAAEMALAPIQKYYPTYVGAIVVVNKAGQVGAACHGIRRFPYSLASPQYETVQVKTVLCS